MASIEALRSEIDPDAAGHMTEEEKKAYDSLNNYQRAQYDLKMTMDRLEELIQQHDENIKSHGAEGNQSAISQKMEIAKKFDDAEKIIKTLKEMISSSEGAWIGGTVKKEDIPEAKKLIDRFDSALKSLKRTHNMGTRAGPIYTDGSTSAVADVHERRRQERAAGRTRANRRDRRTNAEGKQIQWTEAESGFIQQVAEQELEQDKILDVINADLVELKSIAEAMNKQLVIQHAVMDAVSDKIDKQIDTFETTNKRLQEILEQTGGCSRWCPIMMCLVILVALVGYIYQSMK